MTAQSSAGNETRILPGFSASSIPKPNCFTPFRPLNPSDTKQPSKTRWTTSVIFASLPSLNSVRQLHHHGHGCPRLCLSLKTRTSPLHSGLGMSPGLFAPLRLLPLSSEQAASANRSTVIPRLRLDGLLESIRDHGILVPLVVTHTPDDRILAGRLRTSPLDVRNRAWDWKKFHARCAPFQAIHHTNWRSWNITVSAKRISAR